MVPAARSTCTAACGSSAWIAWVTARTQCWQVMPATLSSIMRVVLRWSVVRGSDSRLRAMRPFGDLIQNGAVGAVIPVAVGGQVLQAGCHGLQRAGLLLQRRDMAHRQAAHLGARPVAVAPEGEQPADILERE